MNSVGDTEFWTQVCEDVMGPREGGAIIIVDAEDARKGVGKTSCAVFFARAFADAFGYQFKERDMTLSGQEYLNLYTEQPGPEQPSVAIWDEAVGGGSGDGRRAMSEENVNLGQAWAIMRTRKVLTFVTLPNWGDLDVRLQRLADYRIWCRRDPIGECRTYQIGTNFKGDQLKTIGLGPGEGAEPIEFPDMKTNDDPYYTALKAKKDTLIDSGTLDANEAADDDNEPDPEEIKYNQQVKTALRAVKPWSDERGISQRDAAELIEYSRGWVSDRVQEWKKGKHRELVEEPAHAG